MLLAILNICTQEELESAGAAFDEEEHEDDVQQRRRQIIRNKIRAVGKLSRTFTILRENAELVNELKCVSDQTKLPAGTLGLGAEGMRKGKKKRVDGVDSCADALNKAITTFEEARQSDLQNERLPPPTVSSRSAGKEDDQRLKDSDLDRLAHVIVASPKTDTASPKSNGLSM
jgi:serine/threonine-protein phosphatase 2B catalytic subunit